MPYGPSPGTLLQRHHAPPSTLLTLLVIPTFYEILTDWRDWLGARLFGRTAQPYGSRSDADLPSARRLWTGHKGETASDPGLPDDARHRA